MSESISRISTTQAIDWMRELKEFKIHWIEEPTCADDVLGHKQISEVTRTST